MAVINPSVILRNWGLGIGTIYLTVAVPIFTPIFTMGGAFPSVCWNAQLGKMLIARPDP